MTRTPDPAARGASGTSAPGRGPGAGWRATLWLVGLVTLARLAYLAFLCPYELAADEAQYWDWSRRLGLSYYSKGPGIAWLIAASTALGGDTEWAVRLPAALSAGVAALATAGLARSMNNGGARAAFLAAALVLLIPAYQLTALLMTIDAPYIACWTMACWCAWTALSRAGERRPALLAWAGLGLALGVGFLFKYTILLLVPGLIGAAWAQRREIPPDARSARGVALAAVLAALCTLPVILWNAKHGWPTVAHLLGHLGSASGDAPAAATAAPKAFQIRWPLEFLGTQLGMIGPALAVMAMAIIASFRKRTERPALARAGLFALWTLAPILLFYTLVSFRADAEGNWPIAGYIAPLALGGMWLARGLARHRVLVRRWLADPARPKRGVLRRRPETPAQIAWHWTLAFGLIAGGAMLALHWLDRVPWLERTIPLHRLSGHRDFAQRVQGVVERAARESAQQPVILADQYTRAALLAFYLPGHPSVASATSWMGGRRSSYDYFPDTDPARPELRGRTAVLVGSTPEHWQAAWQLGRLELVLPRDGRRHPVYLAHDFQGPRTPRTPLPDASTPSAR